MEKAAIYRIIDANLNRAREGLRVCEDTARFILNNPGFTLRFKKIRHQLTIISKRFPACRTGGLASRRSPGGEAAGSRGPAQLIKARNSRDDIGKYLSVPSQKKQNKKQIKEIFVANIRRAEEAMRVLEEFSKTVDKKISDNFGRLRFKLYTLEKEVLGCFH